MGLGNLSDSPAIRRFNLGVRAGLAAGERARDYDKAGAETGVIAGHQR